MGQLAFELVQFVLLLTQLLDGVLEDALDFGRLFGVQRQFGPGRIRLPPEKRLGDGCIRSHERKSDRQRQVVQRRHHRKTSKESESLQRNTMGWPDVFRAAAQCLTNVTLSRAAIAAESLLLSV